MTTQNLSNFVVDNTELGNITQLVETPADGTYLPLGSVVPRASYPALNSLYPFPKFNANMVRILPYGHVLIIFRKKLRIIDPI